ncbi:MAG: Asp-tRNA(Asn)/Glu-tRNA(Gln) amidotransferase subunit GatB [bacterium]|jgi:aspartyl-tRNA(Asn)/glutamyl-tRNA(Gln) amidotransferase subunit B
MPVDLSSKYETVIGLEVHAQLKTKTKLFAGDSADFGASPNTHVSPITLGHPGTLPKMNKKAIDYAIKMGLVCNCTIAKHNYFARKNYFYPDLPKGYQISQHTTPICSGGEVHISTSDGERNIRLTRIHLEEDAGKSIHDQSDLVTYLDYNRAGVPLIEIVTEPDLHSSEEAAAYLTQIRKLVRWVGICDGNMEEGSLRCDANVSVRLRGDQKLGTRVEVKNLNSIKHLRHAIEIEVERLSNILEEGGTVLQETRSYDADKGITFSIRTKEDAEDYRYFPEPDLAPFDFTDAFIEQVRASLPTMPEQRMAMYIDQYGLTSYDAQQLTEDKTLSDLFDEIASSTSHKKQLANFLLGPLRAHLNSTTALDWDTVAITKENWNKLLTLVVDGKISFSVAAQRILPVLLENTSSDPLSIAQELNLIQDAGEDEVSLWVKQVLESMPEKVAEYKKGKKGLIGLFVGEVKKISKGKADPKLTTDLLNHLLNQK